MTRRLFVLAMSLLLLSSAAMPAFAQDRSLRRWRALREDPHYLYGLDNRRWIERTWDRQPWMEAANPAAIARFDARAAELRAAIASRGRSGLNERLNTLMNMRTAFARSDGVLTMSELKQLNSRLIELRIALRNRVYF